MVSQTIDRLWRHIEPIPVSGCWLWIGGHVRGGYGTIKLNGHQEMAHRVAYTLYRGEIPSGLTLDHLCRVPACVNPDHLEPVTLRINILRGNGLAARHARKRLCMRGHPLSPLRSRKGRIGRVCQECIRRKGNERVAWGLCRKCGEPATPGRTNCAYHLALQRSSKRRARPGGSIQV